MSFTEKKINSGERRKKNDSCSSKGKCNFVGLLVIKLNCTQTMSFVLSVLSLMSAVFVSFFIDLVNLCKTAVFLNCMVVYFDCFKQFRVASNH